jgi:AcrR family transcriptional regulator
VIDTNELRLVEGMIAAITQKGYASVTIADVARHARVSKRTFYEHFEDKESCFLAAYIAASEETLKAILEAADRKRPWDEQLRAATRAYLTKLEERPVLTRTFLLEIHAAGPRAMSARREVHDRFAELLRAMVQAARKDHPDLRPLSPSMAIAVVGGINELVLVALEKGKKLGELAQTATDLIRAVLAP